MRRLRWLCALVTTAGCALFTSTEDRTGGAPDVLVISPDFESDIEPLLAGRCSIGGCHSLATAQGTLVLTQGASYEAIVNVPARLDPRFRRVAPFQPDSSLLFLLLDADPGVRRGFARMPLSSVPLTPNQIGTIRNWIANGAVR